MIFIIHRSNISKRRKQSLIDLLLFFLFIFSLFLILWGVKIYRDTVIPIRQIILLCCFVTMICVVVFLVTIIRYVNVIWLFLHASIIGGGISFFALLFINKQKIDRTLTVETFAISRSGTLAPSPKNCGQPYVVIEIDGIMKEFIFDCAYRDKIKDFKKAELSYYTGIFGFKVITNKLLLR